ncbi:phosphoribosylaminoimidazolesuccinocarboxamide synthase [Alkalilimnicola sp. S0819]|uniref:phosphoribosylaminoimidazolesuccinocarboxamide synthase n=1 Tax=Alkalilimnicola sp. S0819 TaxID=2613922 RepID=UPI001261A616|nr:phosphoribosylaminoimidazolesuccinocarboxamide synthase [Alkalilimnicola sp. S0819]KAB7628145.1 phosphoribosylaminoimidazolesuccinocarboxamide synthase [Alkalilimnicola sp. S0819]MPQ15031.1 phosphoribosylaminoimidazolesuccinocarboxamide synthase [Alkalilimnicola sp. S0819]
MSHAPEALYDSELKSLPLLHKGKVRDVYAIDEERLLIVTSDRLSAFDVILPDPIPGKGAVLTAVSSFWFARTGHIVPNQLLDVPLEAVIPDPAEASRVAGRAIVTVRARPLPIEAVARGYLIGSGWKDYQASGRVCGIELPPGLRQAQRLPEPLFTPATKAAVGDHDENISFEQAARTIGGELAEQVRELTLRLYGEAVEYAASRGIIIADTKFEFGLDRNDRLILIDEALTPDSSRFWPADQYREGTSPPSFDKQYVRDYLETLDWDKTAPGPRLPAEVIAHTAAKYREAQQRLTGE